MSSPSIILGPKIKPETKLGQELVKKIKLLAMTSLELREAIQQKLETNPFLEEDAVYQEDRLDAALDRQDLENMDEVGKKRKEEERERLGMEPGEEQAEFYDAEAGQNVVWEDGRWDDSPSSREVRKQEEERQPLEECVASRKPALKEPLLWQLGLSGLDEEEMAIGELIIGNLDERGRLSATLEELAELSGAAQDKVLQVLKRVQALDPVGVACRSLSECLEVQVRELGLDGDPRLMRLIRDHLGETWTMPGAAGA